MEKEIMWKSDVGNGIYRNPILFADYSDPDAIRVGDIYYMTASSFNYTPGLPILTSKDLINWKLRNYAISNLPYDSYDIPAHSKGVWAPSIRFHNGWFYIYFGMPDEGIFMVRTKEPLKEWEEPVLVLKGKGLIDPCPFWDEDGRAYIIHAYAKSRIGFKSFLGIFEISYDGLYAISEDHFIFDGTKTQVTIEGPKVYKRNGYYYIFAPAGGVKTGWQTVLRARKINGPYEERIVLKQEDTSINGPHQGALVDTIEKEEWFLHFQDRGAYGRITHLQPVVWKEDWPIIGKLCEGRQNGKPYIFHKKPFLPIQEITYLSASDYFDQNTLSLQWQWLGNHNSQFYSLLEHPGYLRLYSLNPSQKEPVILWNCANVLTEKIICPEFTAKVKMDITNLKEQEVGGVTVIGGEYAYLGVKQIENMTVLVYVQSFDKENGEKAERETIVAALSEHITEVLIEIYIFGKGSGDEEKVYAQFSYSIEENKFVLVEPVFQLSSHTWVGAKIGLFSIAYHTKKEYGFTDFSYLTATPKKEEKLEFQIPKSGDMETTVYMAEYSKTSFNEKDSRQRTFLHYAVQSKNVELVQYLVERIGLSLLDGDIDLITPFELAREINAKEIEEYFEKVCGTILSNMYKNPIRTGMFPDPSIVRVGEDYYMVNSSFIFFPCIPISHSKDLLHWNLIGYAITVNEWAELGELEGGRGYWAPDISYCNGTFYITATYRFNDDGVYYRRQMITSSKRPEGPYSKPIFIEEDGIDPSLFHDEDGRHYMILNRGARILELNEDLTKPISNAVLLYYGDCKRAPEGPHLLKKDGYYYLFLAEGGTGLGHQITAARSKRLEDPFEPCPYNPIMCQKDSKAKIQRCGHGKPVQTQNGEWYMVYLCGRMEENYTLLGRETALDPITFTADGWPIVNYLKGPSVLQKKPNLEEYLFEQREVELFDGDTIPLCFFSPRERTAKGYYLSEHKLYMQGDYYDLDSIYCRNILLQRQTSFDFEAETKLDIICLPNNTDFGITCYYDENTWLKFALFGEKNNISIRIVEHIGTKTITRAVKKLEVETTKQITLKVKTHKLKRSFFYCLDTKKTELFLGTLDQVDYLCDEGYKKGKRFTGPTIGMYAYGKSSQAAFYYFSYLET